MTRQRIRWEGTYVRGNFLNVLRCVGRVMPDVALDDELGEVFVNDAVDLITHDA